MDKTDKFFKKIQLIITSLIIATFLILIISDYIKIYKFHYQGEILQPCTIVSPTVKNLDKLKAVRKVGSSSQIRSYAIMLDCSNYSTQYFSKFLIRRHLGKELKVLKFDHELIISRNS